MDKSTKPKLIKECAPLEIIGTGAAVISAIPATPKAIKVIKKWFK